ncbi:thiamine phosphate synthase [Clostridium sp. SHJSY1]|uniref:thiamine phosphate synthase n=1 Tax=Clostridium sp. SHJSY1 TaxID=2942483 RepID=UPI00287495CE|nr:thiamine phosphate synthase [Clostridium sp. SHJSY1]MDS0524503.1 thiamine phosphate synthase [Clostridium sp. SHJSY1]
MNIIGVTNRKLCKDFYKRINEISKEELKYLILREKDLEYSELKSISQRVKEILKNSNINLIINSNLRIAKEIDAAGVHLSYKDFIKGETKGYKGIVGVSVHNIEEAIEAEKQGASYILYGHVFETDCKKGIPPRGLKELKDICIMVNIPVYAIGGINKDNYKIVLDIGVYGIAIMSSLMKNNCLDKCCIKGIM